MPRGIIGHGWRRPVPGARPRDRAVALIGEFSVSASEEHPSSRYTRTHELAAAEFTTLRLHLLKVAGRVIETATRVRLAFAAACPHAVLFRGLARSFHPAGP